MKNKKIKNLIVIMLIILLILIVVLISISKRTSEEELPQWTQKDTEIVINDLENYRSDKVIPVGNGGMISNYNGDNDTNDLYRKLYILVNYLPELSEVAYKDSSQISEYYNSHKTTIKSNLGLSKEKHFAKFCEYIKETGYKGEKYEDSEIQYATYKYDDQYNTFDLTFKFENFDNDFRLKVHFANSSYTDPIVFYSLVKDQVLNESDIALPENTVN